MNYPGREGDLLHKYGLNSGDVTDFCETIHYNQHTPAEDFVSSCSRRWFC